MFGVESEASYFVTLPSKVPCENSTMSSSNDNVETVRRYLRGIEQGAFSGVKGLFTPTVVIEQLPNRIYPKGVRGTLSQMEVAFEKGRNLFSAQTYEIKAAVAQQEVVAAEVIWTGTLAVGFGSLAAGSKMSCHSAMFFEFVDGKIASQRNYDCFEAW
jgi:ketosteroid isomerase-like protein